MTATLGRYRLEHRLGEGGMGDVYAAVVLDGEDRGQRVCIKVMKPALATNPRAVELFLREARHASRLRHDNIVRILELGRDGGTWFLAMELLDGMAWHDIAQRCWRHGVALPLEVIVGAAADAALALEYAHTLRDRDGRPVGIVHRDISPDNLFLTGDGSTRVLDFGIAKATAPDATSLTEMGELRGKLPYMPPEQMRTNTVDGAADIWALGITLFYLSTAQRPFDRPTAVAIMKAVELEPAISVLEMNPTLPPSFAAVVARCVQKDPLARWSSAHALREALLGLLPAPPQVAEARALLAHATQLAAGDRRPMTAYAAEPAWPSWTKPSSTSSTSSARSGPDVRRGTSAPARSEAARVVPDEQHRLQRAAWDDDGATAQHRPGDGERTMVNAPLLTADESEVDDNGDGDGEGEGEGFEDARTIAEKPSLLTRPDERDDERDDERADHRLAANGEQTVRLTVFPSTADRASFGSGDLTATVVLPAEGIPRKKPASSTGPGLPVWAYGVIAFGVTVVVAVAAAAALVLLR